MVKTLFELCKPRESVFDESKRDDVLDLTDLIENRIDPYRFIEENFLTEGMKVLFETAFKRFHRQGVTGLIKLTQSMGGGKTHNMIALGLLAKHPNLGKVMGDRFKGSHLGKIKVVAFTGRKATHRMVYGEPLPNSWVRKKFSRIFILLCRHQVRQHGLIF